MALRRLPGLLDLDGRRLRSRRARRSDARGGDSGGVLWLRTFRYPGWHASVDGAPAAVGERQPLSAITVSLPAGCHKVEVRVESTREERVGWLLSVAGTSILLAVAATCWRKRSPGKM